ncbi:MAG: pseudouridine synthase [Saprospiraceae bacterium]
MIILHSHLVLANIKDVRLSDYVIGIFPQIPSRKGVKKAIKNGQVYIDGIQANTGNWVRTGQKIELVALDRKPPKIYQLDLPVIYEDDQLAVIQKPAGIIVSGNQFHTIQNALLHNLTPSKAIDAFQLPRPVHRLDHATSGLLLIAKTTTANIHLSEQFKNKTIQKKYQAVAIGQLSKSTGLITEQIEGKEAITKYEVIQMVRSLKTGHLSLLNLYPQTGRTHQLRIHLADLGHPILGDKLYHGATPLLKGKGLFLSAVELTFEHPIGSEMRNFKIETPAKFRYRLEQEERRWLKKNR